MTSTHFISFADIDIGDILYEVDSEDKRHGPILVIFTRGQAGFVGIESNEDANEVLITEYSDADVHYTRTGCTDINGELVALMSRIQ